MRKKTKVSSYYICKIIQIFLTIFSIKLPPRPSPWYRDVKLKLYLKGFLLIIVSFVGLAFILIRNVLNYEIIIPVVDRHLSESHPCPDNSHPTVLVIAFIVGVIYMFIAIAIIVDELFIPCLCVIAEEWKLSSDVAVATLMSLGGTSPEFFISLVGVFLKNDIGFGTILGSAACNMLIVIGICCILTSDGIRVSWWPVFRDIFCYCIVLLTLAFFVGISSPDTINWWEALILHLEYWIYVAIMINNDYWYAFVLRKMFRLEIDRNSVTYKRQAVNAATTRQGLHSVLMSKLSILDKASLAMRLYVGESVEEKFHQCDTDQDGHIDLQEMTQFMSSLDVDIDQKEVQEIMSQIDSNKDGTINLDEFSAWYVQSNIRLSTELTKLFAELDANGDGLVDADEIGRLLLRLGTSEVTGEALKDAIAEMGSKENSVVTLEQFKHWYINSEYRRKDLDRTSLFLRILEDEEGVTGLRVDPPLTEDRTIVNMTWYILVFPVLVLLLHSVPDVQKSGMRKYAYLAFLCCLAWLGVLSYYMVTWILIVGATARIPSVIMGFLFLALGTSVPDALSALIVSRRGRGDMSVSSAISSNIFYVTVGLGIPWLLFHARYQSDISIAASNLFVSIWVLLAVVLLYLSIVFWNAWVLTPNIGYFLFVLYICYFVQQFALTDWSSC